MPLPDASKKSPRVYTLLQNTDLDNVTFDNIQAVGNPIAIEEANEDEMRRLVLVNLCRLVTSGEWTGLLESGGGRSLHLAELRRVQCRFWLRWLLLEHRYPVPDLFQCHLDHARSILRVSILQPVRGTVHRRTLGSQHQRHCGDHQSEPLRCVLFGYEWPSRYHARLCHDRH